MVRTSPEPGLHLVNLKAWFWVESWDEVQKPLPLVVGNVTAKPVAVVVDPGDGTGSFICAGRPPAYAPGAASGCTHVYEKAGVFTATVVVVYEVSYTSLVVPPGTLPGTITLTVRESQALVTG